MPFIENSLVFILNTSIETSMFPDVWKIARITTIFKDGKKTDKSNYRPISVLPVLSRIFEMLITSFTDISKEIVSLPLTRLGLEHYILLQPAY